MVMSHALEGVFNEQGGIYVGQQHRIKAYAAHNVFFHALLL